MRLSISRGGLAALPAMLLLAGCGTQLAEPDAEEQQIDLDVVQYVADATGDDIQLMTTEAELTMQPGLHNRAGCARVGLFRVRCGLRHFSDNVSFTREVTFYDSLGVKQEFFDSLETESINIVASFEGSRTRDNLTVTVNRDRDMTVSGLYGDETERTWNGTGSADVNRTRHRDENGDRVYDMSSTSVVSDVVIAVPRQGTWPLSGTITRDMTVEVILGLEDTRTRTRTVVIEFNGTRFASITVNGETYTLDLDTHEVIRDTT